MGGSVGRSVWCVVGGSVGRLVVGKLLSDCVGGWFIPSSLSLYCCGLRAFFAHGQGHTPKFRRPRRAAGQGDG